MIIGALKRKEISVQEGTSQGELRVGEVGSSRLWYASHGVRADAWRSTFVSAYAAFVVKLSMDRLWCIRLEQQELHAAQWP